MTDLRADTDGPGATPLRADSVGGEVLRRADGVQLIGEMAGSGYRVPPSLARRADGQTVQLTPLLYATLEAVDGQRDHDQVAAAVADRTGKGVSADNVRTLVGEQLRPLGLLAKADGGQPELKRSNPLLGLRFRYAITDPERTRRVTAPFALLFSPFVAVPLLLGFAFVCWWVFFEKGLAQATYEAFQHPGLLILVFVVTVLSAGFHEFGHAAAARRGGSTPGVMGAGVYLVWPAFYTDVTDSYRLGRWGRVRTDLGGLYFNAIVAVGITGVWWATGYDALLLVVATQILQMLQQLTPLVRFDGYHVLADVTGVPDLFHRIKPTLVGALPWRWGDPEARLLKPWARVVVTLWVLVVVPMLAFALVMMVLALPRIIGTAWARVGQEQDRLAASWSEGDLVRVAAGVLTVLAVVLPVAAIAYMLTRLVRQVGVGTWRATAGRPVRRTLAGAVALALVAGLAWVWWPDGDTYRPIQPHETGTLTEAVRPIVALGRPAPTAGFERGDRGTVRTVWDGDQPLPTAEEPRPAVILVPRPKADVDPDAAPSAVPAEDPTLVEPDADGGAVAGPAPTADPGDVAAPGTAEEPSGWVFPFDQPLAPGEGDNQAMATNTTDGTVQYDVALAMVWVEDGADALNTNEAYAFASCTSCASVAVAFQVVMVIGDNDVAVPQNLAGAVNYDCVNCLSYALAQQLFITLDGPLSDEAMAQLDAIWADIAAFGAGITGIPLDELDDRLDDFETQILGVIETDRPGTLPRGSATPSPTATPSESASPTATPTEDPGTLPGEEPAPSTDPTTDPSAEPSAGSAGTATPSAGPSASATPSSTGGATASPTPDGTPAAVQDAPVSADSTPVAP